MTVVEGIKTTHSAAPEDPQRPRLRRRPPQHALHGAVLPPAQAVVAGRVGLSAVRAERCPPLYAIVDVDVCARAGRDAARRGRAPSSTAAPACCSSAPRPGRRRRSSTLVDAVVGAGRRRRRDGHRQRPRRRRRAGRRGRRARRPGRPAAGRRARGCSAPTRARRAVHAHAGAARARRCAQPVSLPGRRPGVRHAHEGHRLPAVGLDGRARAAARRARPPACRSWRSAASRSTHAPRGASPPAPTSVAVISDLLDGRSRGARARGFSRCSAVSAMPI